MNSNIFLVAVGIMGIVLIVATDYAVRRDTSNANNLNICIDTCRAQSQTPDNIMIIDQCKSACERIHRDQAVRLI